MCNSLILDKNNSNKKLKTNDNNGLQADRGHLMEEEPKQADS